MLKIALPNKGRLADDTRELFTDAGLDVRMSGERALTASLGGEFQALFVRAQDIPEFVADGVADAGVTGWDLVCEAERPVESRLDLGFGRCRLVVAAREESGIAGLADLAGLDGVPRVATVFPRVAGRFFADAGRAVSIVPVSGAAEIAPHLGIADIIVDITSSGSTLRVNGMREVVTVLESSARLIAPTAAGDVWPAGKRRALDELLMALGSVLRARGQRYVMANVPRAALDRVTCVLPGLGGPTVIDLLNGGSHVAAPELSADIVERGIVLTGGGALLKNLDKRLSIETGLPVSVAEDPLASVVLGTGKMLSDFDLLKRVKWENTMTSGM